MDRFEWQRAQSVAEAAALATGTVADAMLSPQAGPSPQEAVLLKAGGVDVLDLMKEGLLRPRRLVDLSRLPGLGDIVEDGNGGLRIGALVTLERLAADTVLRRRHMALAQAAAVSASPQIRHIATLGGNLLQRPRCWYLRSAAHHCLRKGGEHCFAFDGDNRYHAVFGNRHCAIVHPSTPATALAALDARVELADAQGASRVAALKDFLLSPETDFRRENTLRAGEVLTAVLLPPLSPATRSVHLKMAEKPSFDWPIADVAVALEIGPDGNCRRAAVVLGAAAPVPWRAVQAEAALTGVPINEETAQAAGQAAVAGAAPLSRNAYKLPIFATLVRRAILLATGVGGGA